VLVDFRDDGGRFDLLALSFKWVSLVYGMAFFLIFFKIVLRQDCVVIIGGSHMILVPIGVFTKYSIGPTGDHIILKQVFPLVAVP